MKDLKDIIKVLIVLGILVVNAFVIYILLYDPFGRILIEENQPYNLPKSNTFIEAITLITIVLLFLSSIVLLIKIYKTQKIFAPAPLLTLLVIGAIRMVSLNVPKYPSSISGYFRDGYYYIEETWWNMPNRMRIHKKWKSIFPYDGKSSSDEIRYKLDSSSITKEE